MKELRVQGAAFEGFMVLEHDCTKGGWVVCGFRETEEEATKLTDECFEAITLTPTRRGDGVVTLRATLKGSGLVRSLPWDRAYGTPDSLVETQPLAD